MRKNFYWVLGGAAILGLLLLANLFGSGRLALLHADDGWSRSRDAVLAIAASFAIVWGMVAAPTSSWRTKAKKVSADDSTLRRDPPLAPPLVRHEPIPGTAIRYDDYVVGALRPSSVLLALANFHGQFSRSDQLTSEHYLERTGGNPSAAELSDLEQKKLATRDKYLNDGNFQRATERLAQAGVECAFGGQGDYCGEFSVLRITASPACLSLLEAMAADDCGMVDADERANAAERFRIFMLRNYHPDYQANRQIYPNVGPSPYHPSGSWKDT